MYSMFGNTLRESTFFAIKQTKSKSIIRMVNETLENIPSLATTNIRIDVKKKYQISSYHHRDLTDRDL